MSKQGQTASIRHRLQAQREVLRSRHSRVQQDLRREVEGLIADAPDRAARMENDEALLEIDEATIAEIAAIDAALLQLDQGRYGICSRCHVPIGARRLAVVPHAITCAPCALAESALAQ